MARRSSGEEGQSHFDFDVIVIGAGTAGLTIAKALRYLSKGKVRVAMVERETGKIGGDCLYTGCIPSKTLLATARLYHQIRHDAGERGIRVDGASLDFAAALKHTRAVIEQIAEEDDSPAIFTDMGVELIWGEARFLDSHTIQVGSRTYTAEKFAITTGSRPALPAVPGLNNNELVTNENFLELKQLPRSLLIIGGGPIAAEFSQMFTRFGSKVTIVQRHEQILPREDAELASMLQQYLEAEGVTVLTNAVLERVEEQQGEKVITVKVNGASSQVHAEVVLAAMGRTPNIEALNLEAAGVELAWENGRVKGIGIDARLRTSAANIWAAGDIAGPYYFTHVAEQEGRFVAQNILGGKQKRDYRVLPWVTFTDPELAHLGLTETEARAAHGEVIVTRLKFSQIDRARTDGHTEGMLKLITTRGVAGSPLAVRLLGAHILGPAAGELIHEFAIVMKNRLNPGLAALTIHAYPTLSLANRQVLGKRFIASDGEA